MKSMIRLIALVAALVVPQLCMGQAPVGAPAGATAICNDGTYFNGATKQGGCRGHKGIKTWFGAAAIAPAKAAPVQSAPPPVAATAPAPSPAMPAPKAASNFTVPAPAGGAGQVWLNTASNVYHCPGAQWYGKTKIGVYMTEDQARAKGARADHGKPCK